MNAGLLQAAHAACMHSGRSLTEEVAAQAGSTPRAALEMLANAFDLPATDTAAMLALAPAFDLLPLPQAQERHAALLRGPQGAIVAVIDDPFDTDLSTWLSAKAGMQAGFRLALRADILAYLARQEESARALDHLAGAADKTEDASQTAAVLSLATVAQASSPAVRLLDSTMYDALKAGASDIHFESTPNGLSVKYRVDGVLDHATQANGRALAGQAISRLKVLAGLDIAERRVPQDGSFRVAANGREIDLRLSIMPSIHGEDAVVRILDKRTLVEAHGALTLEALGFDLAALASLRELAAKAYGMLLVTGPTGSGKTTTLYAALAEIHNGREKIITIEDPVEYQLPGILQIPVNEKKGLTFARGLRSILRHDPDKIMVGEIRDKETAEIAVQSALTGHLVLTTVHANSVFDVFGRFTHMGIDTYGFTAALNGVWAQRLLRMNCPHCSEPHAVDATMTARAGITREAAATFNFRRGRGCGECRGSGYKGRRAVAEILVLNDALREAIVARRPLSEIKAAARRNGTRTLFEAALELVAQGNTTLEEVLRVSMHE